MKYIHISDSVNSIGNYILDFDSNCLKEVIIDDSEMPLKLGHSYSSGCFSSKTLEKVHLGRNLSYSYYIPPFGIGNSNIKEIHIGDYVTDIKGLSLSDHKALKKMTIGKGLVEVPDLSSHSNLASLTLNSEVPPKASEFTNAQYIHLNIYVPKGTLAAYQSADVWKNFWNLQEMETTAISNTITNKQPAKELRYYDAAGRETNGARKGLNIIKMSDGTTRKVIVK